MSKKDRGIVMVSYCKTNGAQRFDSRDISSLNLCGDKTCSRCSMLGEAIKKEAELAFKYIMGIDHAEEGSESVGAELYFNKDMHGKVEYLSPGEIMERYGDVLPPKSKGELTERMKNAQFPLTEKCMSVLPEGWEKIGEDLLNIEQRLVFGPKYVEGKMKGIALIEKYKNNGGLLFRVVNVDMLRDGGTLVIDCEARDKSARYEMDKNLDEVRHLGKKVTDDAALEYLRRELNKYISRCHYSMGYAQRIVDNIKTK